jgi:hypothetical protein
LQARIRQQADLAQRREEGKTVRSCAKQQHALCERTTLPPANLSALAPDREQAHDGGLPAVVEYKVFRALQNAKRTKAALEATGLEDLGDHVARFMSICDKSDVKTADEFFEKKIMLSPVYGAVALANLEFGELRV